MVLAMAHRGRLNVLANIIGKSPQEIFREFEDAHPELYRGGGDVKYHLGYYNAYTTSSGRPINLSLCFNPSHLEFVDPVAEGLMRAKQDRAGDFQRETAMALLIHGDAAFAGEGIVQETLNLSQLAGYATGGTLHVIVNNQIGFTTPPGEARSMPYASDVAKMLKAPIFRVNGEHPEDVAQVIDVAMDFRRTFRRDVVIDMYCYRRWGHNEGDEPTFTQPLVRRAIDERMSVRDAYLEQLLLLGELTLAEAEEIAQRRRVHLEEALSLARREDFVPQPRVLGEIWKGYYGGRERPGDDVPTGVPREQLAALLARLTELPAGFHLHGKLQRIMHARQAMARGERPLDWSTAEALAMASLAAEGYRVRLSGQDSVRGTFSQRHAVLHDTEDGRTYMPLRHVAADQAPVEIYNSPLCEGGALGFEYGYSLNYPDGLILWEAQFGDFVNAAQVIIDQFIASAEDKWRHLSGIVLLLPHASEGQGPEHSSARPERFLQLAVNDNLQVVVPGTPAQYFHCLRRQVKRRWQKPLVVLTPKSLLRHQRVVSPLEDFSAGRFRRVIPDPRGGEIRRCAHPAQRGQDLLGTARAAGKRRSRRHRAGGVGTTLSAAGGATPGRAGAVCRRHARLLGSGGAGEHGGLPIPEAAVRPAVVLTVPLRLHRPARLGHAGHGIGKQLSPGTRRTARTGASGRRRRTRRLAVRRGKPDPWLMNCESLKSASPSARCRSRGG